MNVESTRESICLTFNYHPQINFTSISQTIGQHGNSGSNNSGLHRDLEKRVRQNRSGRCCTVLVRNQKQCFPQQTQRKNTERNMTMSWESLNPSFECGRISSLIRLNFKLLQTAGTRDSKAIYDRTVPTIQELSQWRHEVRIDYRDRLVSITDVRLSECLQLDPVSRYFIPCRYSMRQIEYI